MNIHFNPAMTWGSLGARVLTNSHIGFAEGASILHKRSSVQDGAPQFC